MPTIQKDHPAMLERCTTLKGKKERRAASNVMPLLKEASLVSY